MGKYLTCSCSLPDINPQACQACNVWIQNQQDYVPITTTPWEPYPGYPGTPWIVPATQPTTINIGNTKKIKRVTKTVEKYDKDGNYKGKKVITKEYEDVEQPVYEWKITSAGTSVYDAGNTLTTGVLNTDSAGNTVTTKNDVPFTYTNGVASANALMYNSVN